MRAHRAEIADREIRARLLIAADGRKPRVAEVAGLAAKQKSTGDSPISPTIEVCHMPAHAKLAAWKSDIETKFYGYFIRISPAAPAIREGERISPFLWMLQLPNQSRTVVTSGLAMIGATALASDPAWGVGYGWALQSAEWLVDCAAEALRHGVVVGSGSGWSGTVLHRRVIVSVDALCLLFRRRRGPSRTRRPGLLCCGSGVSWPFPKFASLINRLRAFGGARSAKKTVFVA